LVVNFRRAVIIAELQRPEVARPGNFVNSFCVFGKTTPSGTIFKILFRKFTWRHRLTLCSNVVKSVPREIHEIMRHLLNKKIWLPLKLSLLRRSRPKSVRTIPQQCAYSAPDFIQIGSLSAEL